MIQTQQLSPNTLLVEMSGHFHSKIAKELALLVFRSHRLGFSTFLFDLNQVSFMDVKIYRHLACIRQGLQNKGGTWRILGSPSTLENHLLFGTNLDQLPKATWN